MTPQYFGQVYANNLRLLYNQPDSGFPILMIAIPLLERYLRQKSSVFEAKLPENSPFYVELASLFPALNVSGRAREFWHVFRNGILHQATLSERTQKGTVMPEGWLGNCANPVEFNQGEIWINPVAFAETVLKVIEADFSTFQGRGSQSHPLSVPYIIDRSTGRKMVVTGTCGAINSGLSSGSNGSSGNQRYVGDERDRKAMKNRQPFLEAFVRTLFVQTKRRTTLNNRHG